MIGLPLSKRQTVHLFPYFTVSGYLSKYKNAECGSYGRCRERRSERSLCQSALCLGCDHLLNSRGNGNVIPSKCEWLFNGPGRSEDGYSALNAGTCG
jgi:hypothetical protein